MDAKVLLKKVADSISLEKYTIPGVNFDFFGYDEGEGMYVKDGYILAAEKYTHIDMMYDFFDWQNGVGFYALLQANEILKDDKYIEFIKGWVDYHIEKGLPPKTINTTAPLLCVLELYKKYGDSKYKELCEVGAQYCISEALRADEGALEHTVLGVNERFASQIWADTLFMGALFLARWGSFTGQNIYLKEAARQLILHYKYLTNKETGLMFHGYNCLNRNNMSSVLWGRANGWGVMASVEILPLLPDYFPQKEIIIKNLKRHIDNLIKYQQSDGSWCTVIDNANTYKETTAVSAFYFGIKKALRLGYINGDYDEALTKAFDYLVGKIDNDGTIKGTSGGTPVMRSVDEYNRIPCVMSYYGQGMGLMAITENIKSKIYFKGDFSW